VDCKGLRPSIGFSVDRKGLRPSMAAQPVRDPQEGRQSQILIAAFVSLKQETRVKANFDVTGSFAVCKATIHKFEWKAEGSGNSLTGLSHTHVHNRANVTLRIKSFH
jgi:hypothetical protein